MVNGRVVPVSKAALHAGPSAATLEGTRLDSLGIFGAVLRKSGSHQKPPLEEKEFEPSAPCG